MDKAIIEAIIRRIPKGSCFDAHTVIKILMEKYTEAYLQAYNQQSIVEAFHSNLAKEIDAFTLPANGKLIERVGRSWSQNIHNKYSTCTCWKKL